ncbi:hypothetical protein VTK56DRAFT_6092 [Thermocarpiscus australiensis]
MVPSRLLGRQRRVRRHGRPPVVAVVQHGLVVRQQRDGVAPVETGLREHRLRERLAPHGCGHQADEAQVSAGVGHVVRDGEVHQHAAPDKGRLQPHDVGGALVRVHIAPHGESRHGSEDLCIDLREGCLRFCKLGVRGNRVVARGVCDVDGRRRKGGCHGAVDAGADARLADVDHPCAYPGNRLPDFRHGFGEVVYDLLPGNVP